jgi:glycerophosphoryl diester phosphodiesterase
MRCVLATLTLLALSEAAWGEPPQVFAPYSKPTLIAHRGASGAAPEHTLAAYELALQQGADFVEPDLQLTKDGVLVCVHDTSLERTTNVEEIYPDRATMVNGKQSWPVVEFTLAEISQLDAGCGKVRGLPVRKCPRFKR